MLGGETGFDAAAVEARLRRHLFPFPREESVFRLALGGMAATGAWRAGEFASLAEALALWEDKKRGDGRPTVPDHELRLGAVGGASGGGPCAAPLARAAGPRHRAGPWL